MERAAAHYSQYYENTSFAVKLETQWRNDGLAWACVVRFYAIMHLTQAYLCTKKDRSLHAFSRHEDRSTAIARCPELKAMKVPYRELKDISENIRYVAGFDYDATTHQETVVAVEKIETLLLPKVRRQIAVI
jgi:hypothetical protein